MTSSSDLATESFRSSYITEAIYVEIYKKAFSLILNLKFEIFLS